MQKLLKEPLTHFVLMGIALFVLYQWVSSEEAEEPTNQIVVTEGRIEQMVNIFQKTWQRQPSPEELKGIIDDFVVEEIYYRQAKAMGIDSDDTVIRRRLRQKYEFLTDDTSALIEPTEEELKEYYTANQGKFRHSPRYSFRQVYFSAEKRTEDEVAKELSFLKEGREVGDTSLMPSEFKDVQGQSVDGTFGPGFSDKLDLLPVGEWTGPVRSSLGWHLVNVESRTLGELPELEAIRPLVEREWDIAKRIEVRKKINERLLSQYEVKIEWPAAENSSE